MANTLPNLASRLESVIGTSQVVADPSVCLQYAVDEVIPSVVAKPTSAQQIAEIVRFAALEKLALIPCGHRTKLEIGMPPSRYDIALDMTGLHQIVHYDPGDLTVSVDAGASFNDLAAPLYKENQFLPLSVPFYFESTIGGIIASGVDSSLRHSYGTARDFLIGAEFVDGTGRLCKSGGRVVKNVTGYDLHKLLISSLGTLAVITRLNFRTFPAAPASRGFVLPCRTHEEALNFNKLVEHSPVRAASIDLVSPQLMQLFLEAEKKSLEPPASALHEKLHANAWHLCVSVEGTPEVCERASREFDRLATSHEAKDTPLITLNESEGADLWHYLGQSVPLLLEASPPAAIFKISTLPARLPALLQQLLALADQASLPHATLTRACGVLYFAMLPNSDDPASLQRLSEAASRIFSFSTSEDASVSLPWCPITLKRSTNILRPSRPDFALMRRLKSAFDPQNIFARGRFLSP